MTMASADKCAVLRVYIAIRHQAEQNVCQNRHRAKPVITDDFDTLHLSQIDTHGCMP